VRKSYRKSARSSVLHMVIYMFQCYSLKSSHPCLLPLSPKVCSLHLCLLCCLACRIVITVFLNSIYVCTHILFQIFSHLGYYRVLSRVTCAIQSFFVGYPILNTSMYTCPSQTPNLSLPHPFPVTVNLFSVSLFLFCK